MGASIFRLLIAGLLCVAGLIMGAYHLIASGGPTALMWFGGLVYMGAFVAPSPEHIAAIEGFINGRD